MKLERADRSTSTYTGKESTFQGDWHAAQRGTHELNFGGSYWYPISNAYSSGDTIYSPSAARKNHVQQSK